MLHDDSVEKYRVLGNRTSPDWILRYFNFRITMPRRICAAAYCDSTNKLFKWPDKDKKSHLHKAWSTWVATDVANFKLNSNSRICCKHFTEDCFLNLYRYVTEHDQM